MDQHASNAPRERKEQPPAADEDHFIKLKQENSRLLHEDIRNRKVVYRGLPEVITLNHTNICNLKCIMCPRSKKQGRDRLDRRVLDYVIAELFPTARKVVLTTSGGEPLAVDFDFLVEKAIQYGVKVDAVTNGVLLTPEVYKRARLAFDHLNISCDSHVPEVYEYVRCGASFDRLYRNLTAIRDARLEAPDNVLFSLSAVVMKCNIDHLVDFVHFAAEMNADAVALQRARSYLNQAPHELPENVFSEEEIMTRIGKARDAAQEIGMNLLLSEFGWPNVEGKPLRPKIPQTIEDQGLCWFMAQNFGVMYTGEVYPCCVPNDHCLGDINYQHPVDIWNGMPAQRLRAAILSGRGTLFCSGCMNAAHLPARKPGWLIQPMQRARMINLHLKNKVKRRFNKFMGRSKITPPVPNFKVMPETLRQEEMDCKVTPFHYKHELLVRSRWDRSMWFLDKGGLFRMEDLDQKPECLAQLRNPPAPLSSCLHLLDPQTALVGFSHEGRIERIKVQNGSVEAQEVLKLSHPHSFVRETLAEDGQGILWAGEYGIHPGARCAHIYRSTDGGAHFEKIKHFEEARHIHTVYALKESNRILVTTGDLMKEQRLFISSNSGSRFRTLLPSYSGFSAIAETEHFVHFGSDMLDENGFVRWRKGFKDQPEFRPLEGRYDLQIRHIIPLPGNRLAALANLDRNLLDGWRTACVLLSMDEGATWSVGHTFEQGNDNHPERLLLLSTDPVRLLTVYTDQPQILEFPL